LGGNFQPHVSINRPFLYTRKKSAKYQNPFVIFSLILTLGLAETRAAAAAPFALSVLVVSVNFLATSPLPRVPLAAGYLVQPLKSLKTASSSL